MSINVLSEFRRELWQFQQIGGIITRQYLIAKSESKIKKYKDNPDANINPVVLMLKDLRRESRSIDKILSKWGFFD